MLNREQPEAVPAKQLTDIKLSIVKTSGPLALPYCLTQLTLHNIAETYARPWFERYRTAYVNEHWYKDYQTR